ncbi:hypothetical protein PFICI_12357 [Pestalotiopsis fici W106-1]|uniref:Enoyl reductase (ER) domain-containing protein n=1 Tax=Pestalotiopsis fici (strain W106-1 / CGMCC3.15140) TaxID=1229662 RepID=W3WNH8_PESFW|nr:uncharacterized protein PFICI_12357 [Pestalotiopsis fici W106-1]ETS75413.1 hypothetical protein PFICI_12357 [Pestalotiopsis fici W106-1]
MSSVESNRAAWLVGEGVNPLEVRPGPDQTKPEAGEVIIKVAAVAINPSEPIVQDKPVIPLAYPHVLGSDIAGTVAKVGSGVTRFQVGDRVIGHCLGLVHGGARHGGFQEYTACLEAGVAKIPDSLSFEQAAVLPLSISTSSVALYEHLKLREPAVELGGQKTGNEAVLIWGGATSIGCSAIQLAVASGYKVVTTASTKNHGFVRSLVATGAEDVTVFDYADADITTRIISHFKDAGLAFAGAYDCISKPDTVRVCADVAATFGSKLVSVVLFGVESPRPDVEVPTVWSTNAVLTPEGSGRVWEKFVPGALISGTLKAKPEPQVVGKGLGQIQDAMNTYKKGVSATKIVVTL